MDCVCGICGREYVWVRRQGHTQETCNTCIQDRRRKLMKAKATEYKGGKCVACGYNRCLSALHFHHLDPEAKEFAISTYYNKSWEVVKAELDKCVLLCGNCHAELHAGLINLC